jgi:predicted DNA-binding protein with PD1-like motif
MEFKQFGKRYIVRLDVGEEITETLKQFCSENGIESGSVMGIGAIREARISYFDMAKRDYIDKEISEVLELTSLMGNISTMNGEPFLHLHVTLSDSGFNVFGGHLSAGIISATGEIFIDTHEMQMVRKFYPETGFRLLALEDD